MIMILGNLHTHMHVMKANLVGTTIDNGSHFLAVGMDQNELFSHNLNLAVNKALNTSHGIRNVKDLHQR